MRVAKRSTLTRSCQEAGANTLKAAPSVRLKASSGVGASVGVWSRVWSLLPGDELQLKVTTAQTGLTAWALRDLNLDPGPTKGAGRVLGCALGPASVGGRLHGRAPHENVHGRMCLGEVSSAVHVCTPPVGVGAHLGPPSAHLQGVGPVLALGSQQPARNGPCPLLGAGAHGAL